MAMWQRPPAKTLLAAHLRGELERGRWRGKMPGVIRLARELGAARNTVENALCELEREGLLVPQGHGRGRVIAAAGAANRARGLRIGILTYEPSDRSREFLVELLYQLREAGHDSAFADGTLTDLGMDLKRVARLVEKTAADAWVVVSGSREVLAWFAGQPVPAFALFGRRMRVPIASTGPNKVPAVSAVVDRLVELGHRRIVMMVREERRKPEPGYLERAFLAALEAGGIPTGPYHLPDWGNDRSDFQRGLYELFRHTPPTALLLDEAVHYVAAQQHLALRGILAPRDVSMVCLHPDPAFAWCDPPVSRIDFDSKPWVRQVVRWAGNVALGKDDRRKTPTPAKFVEGGTIGPAPE